VEAASVIAANGSFTAPCDNGFGQGWKLSRFAGFASGLRAAGRAFTFKSSHVASFEGDLVRARSGVYGTGRCPSLNLPARSSLRGLSN
jgi:hypothetical protein